MFRFTNVLFMMKAPVVPFNTFNIKSNNSVKNIINDILILQHQVKSQINPELGLHIDLN